MWKCSREDFSNFGKYAAYLGVKCKARWGGNSRSVRWWSWYRRRRRNRGRKWIVFPPPRRGLSSAVLSVTPSIHRLVSPVIVVQMRNGKRKIQVNSKLKKSIWGHNHCNLTMLCLVAIAMILFTMSRRAFLSHTRMEKWHFLHIPYCIILKFSNSSVFSK